MHDLPKLPCFALMAVFALTTGFVCLEAYGQDPGGAIAPVASQTSYRVTTGTYDASIAADGCLTSLRIAGREFLNPHVSISRGTYFYQEGVLPTPTVSQPEPGVVVAEGEKASVRYEFREASMKWTVTNKTEAQMAFYMILDPSVTAARIADGPIERTVLATECTDTTWYSGQGMLHAIGCTKLWGPWEGATQVWEAMLAGGETRDLTLTCGLASAEDQAAIAALTAPAPPVDLAVNSPLDYQVFQRRSRTEGEVLLSGRLAVDADTVRVRLTGKPLEGDLPEGWGDAPFLPHAKTFTFAQTLPAGGWYTLEAEALLDGAVVATARVERFGVGEVFVGAGQSNSTNSGQFQTKQTSGMVSSFGGATWQLADDPQPGVHDKTAGGSFYPAFGDALYAKYGVPIGVAVTGHGGTSVNQWQPGDELHNWMMARILKLGPNGFRAVLWHQGESDVGMSSEEYQAKLTRIILASKDQAGWEFPWFIAKVSYHNPDNTAFENIRSAHQALWDAGVALEGPDTDTLMGENRDFEGKGIHFSPVGLKAHGEMWAEDVGVYLDQVLTHP